MINFEQYNILLLFRAEAILLLEYMQWQWETRLTENVMPPEPYLLRLRGLSIKNAYVHGNRCGKTDKSIQCVLQPEKRIGDGLYKQHSEN